MNLKIIFINNKSLKKNIILMDKRQNLVEIRKGQTGKGLLIENDGYLSLDEKYKHKAIKEDIGGETETEWSIPNPFIVDAVFQKYGIKNANGRIYPERTLKREVENYQQRIADKRALGECDHPESSTISLKQISHNIIELHWEDATLVGKMELNITEGFRRYGIISSQGDNVANLLINGYKIGVSSRAVGSVERKFDTMIVGDDLELISWDVVADPSTPNAYISSNGPEELQQYVEHKEIDKDAINEKIDKINKILSE